MLASLSPRGVGAEQRACLRSLGSLCRAYAGASASSRQTQGLAAAHVGDSRKSLTLDTYAHVLIDD